MSEGKLYFAEVSPAKIVSGKAEAYRLLKRLDGTLVLQGAYPWQQGFNGGFEWKEIPTIIEEEE